MAWVHGPQDGHQGTEALRPEQYILDGSTTFLPPGPGTAAVVGLDAPGLRKEVVHLGIENACPEFGWDWDQIKRGQCMEWASAPDDMAGRGKRVAGSRAAGAVLHRSPCWLQCREEGEYGRVGGEAEALWGLSG